MRRAAFGAGVFVLSLASSPAGPSLAAGLPSGGYGQAMRWYGEAADAGHPDAQFLLAVILERGLRGEPDPRAAVKWYEMAAAAGHLQAQYRLGVLHAGGEGMEPDPPAAERWYRMAAERGHVRAQFNLALLYEDLSDPLAAAYWYEAAARQGLTEAQYNLALLYAGTFDGLYDLIRAYAWMDAAARQGHPLAEAGRAALELVMSPAAHAEGREVAAELAACCLAPEANGVRVSRR